MAKETILVVDDEQNIIELARLYLEQDGYRVEQANTGQQALDKIKQVDPALMILDLMLPGDRRLGSVPPRARQQRSAHHHADGAR